MRLRSSVRRMLADLRAIRRRCASLRSRTSLCLALTTGCNSLASRLAAASGMSRKRWASRSLASRSASSFATRSNSAAAPGFGSFMPITLRTGSSAPRNSATLRRVHHDRPLRNQVAADVHVAVGKRVLEIGQLDAVTAHAGGVGLNLVAPDGAAAAADVHDPRHLPELPLQHPVLHRLEVVEGVDVVAVLILGSIESVAVDLARRGLWRDLREKRLPAAVARWSRAG